MLSKKCLNLCIVIKETSLVKRLFCHHADPKHVCFSCGFAFSPNRPNKSCWVSYFAYFQVDNWGPGSGVVKLRLILRPEKGKVEPVREDDKNIW